MARAIVRSVLNSTSSESPAVAATTYEDVARPIWAASELPQSRMRGKPALGLPRFSTSVCPNCNREAVDGVLRGELTRAEFAANPGIVRAEIFEDSGRVLVRKTCQMHGSCEDVLATDAAFFRRIESLYLGHDVECADDGEVHGHGAVSITTGRGLALIVDLTNRCNLKCSPCFMDANHAPYVHELSIDDVSRILERARAVKPRRDFNILLAGGEPTIARNFLEAVREARSQGFKRICVVTNGIRFAQEPEFAVEAKAAGLHQVYLQLDGVSNESHWHRGAANLFDVKQRALENVAAAGMMVNLQVAVAKGLNNQHVADVVRFALQHLGKVRGVLFQPIMFAGRDANVTDEERRARRYTLADLAHDLHAQMPSMDWQPMRDWFPTSAFSVFANYFDHLHPDAARGSIYADAHPDQAMFSPLVVNQRTGCAMPISSFVNVERLLQDVVAITDGWRGATWGRARMALAIVRNYDRRHAPQGFRLRNLFELLTQFEPRFKAVGDDWSARDNADPEWRLLNIQANWFQDLFNFDLAAAVMDSTPVATVEGEIGFSAYNALGWRKIIEHRHQTATLAEWHRTHGRHPIYANGAFVQLGTRAEIKQRREASRELVGG